MHNRVENILTSKCRINARDTTTDYRTCRP